MAITPFTPEQRAEWFAGLPKKACGAGMLLIDRASGKLLAAKATYKHHWSFPGGVVDALESPKHAAIRELREETGLAINPGQVEFAGVFHRSPGNGELDSLYFLFRSYVDSVDITLVPDGEEIEALEWVTPDEFEEKCHHIPHLVYGARLVSAIEKAGFKDEILPS